MTVAEKIPSTSTGRSVIDALTFIKVAREKDLPISAGVLAYAALVRLYRIRLAQNPKVPPPFGFAVHPHVNTARFPWRVEKVRGLDVVAADRYLDGLDERVEAAPDDTVREMVYQELDPEAGKAIYKDLRIITGALLPKEVEKPV